MFPFPKALKGKHYYKYLKCFLSQKP
jgi:hypothetical protein